MGKTVVFLGKHGPEDVWDELWNEIKGKNIEHEKLNIRGDSSGAKIERDSSGGQRMLKIHINGDKKFIWVEEQRDWNCDYLKHVLLKNSLDELYVAVHRGRVAEKKLRKGPDLQKLNFNFVEFLHDGEEVYQRLKAFKNSLGRKDMVSKFNELCEIIKKKPIIPKISLLKHRLVHLFLSIDVDLQKIEEILSTRNGANRAKGYFKKAFSKEKLSCKLKEAKKLVEGDKKAPNEILKKGVKGAVDVDNIRDAERKKSAKRILAQIDRLLANSDIKKLSGIIDKAEFDKLKTHLRRKSFHDWLCDLDDCLDKLREAIQSK